MMTSDRGVLPARMLLASSISAMNVDTPFTDLQAQGGAGRKGDTQRKGGDGGMERKMIVAAIVDYWAS